MGMNAQGVGKSAANFGYENRLVVNVDFEQAAWNTVASHKVFSITGAVVAFVIFRVTETLTSGGAAQISFGRQSDTDSYAAAQVITNLTAGVLVNPGASTTQARGLGVFRAAGTTPADSVLSSIANYGYEITVADLTNGSLECICYWTPISEGATVVAGTGTAM